MKNTGKTKIVQKKKHDMVKLKLHVRHLKGKQQYIS